MNNHLENHAEDPHLQRIRRKLVRLMLGSIIITFVLVGLVLAAVIYKIMQTSDPSPSLAANTPMPLEQPLDLEVDGQIISYNLHGDILVLHVESPNEGDKLILYNVRLQRIVSQLRFVTKL